MPALRTLVPPEQRAYWRSLHDLEESPQATELLVEERLEYSESLQSYYERLLRLNGGDKSTIFSIDNVHSEFV